MNARNIHVLFLVSSLCVGGAEKHAVTLANRLDRNRFRCSLAYLKPIEALLEQLDASRLENIVSLDVRSRVDRRAIASLVEVIDHSAVDVIVCVNEYPVVYGLLAARRAKQRPKLVEVFHTTTFGRLKDRLQMLLYRQLFRRLDLLVYVSRNQLQYWRARGLHARSAVAIHNGVDCDFFHNGYSATDKLAMRARYGFNAQDYLIGICAALRPEKAHADLLRAVALLRTRGLKACCLIIGDGPERPDIERQVEHLGLAGSVAITGFQADVRPLVVCCDVIALVSHAVETFSIAALEAMALAKPMVQSRIGGADEQIIDGVNGYLFSAGDVDGLAYALERLSDPSTRARFGTAAARKTTAEFSEAVMLAQYSTELYDLVRAQ